MVIYGGLWWIMVNYGDLWWFVYGDLWWFMVIYSIVICVILHDYHQPSEYEQAPSLPLDAILDPQSAAHWWFHPPLKNMKVSWGDDISNIWNNKKCSKPPTSNGSIVCMLQNTKYKRNLSNFPGKKLYRKPWNLSERIVPCKRSYEPLSWV